MRRYGLAALAALLLLATVTTSAYVFIEGPPRWPAGNIVVHLQAGSSTSGLIDGSGSWNASIEDSLARWNFHIPGRAFTVVRGSSIPIFDGDGYNSVFFSSTVFGRSFGSGVIAVTTRWTTNGGTTRVEGDVVLNSAFPWNSYGGTLRAAAAGGTLLDVKRVTLHEFGHVLGLNHPDQAGQSVAAVMNSSISNIDALQTDDINGVKALYGSVPSCSYALTSSGTPAPSAGAAGAVSVITTAGCSWTAVSNSPGMITITSGPGGTGSGTITFVVSANPTATQRVGTLTIAGQTFTITQASSCGFGLNASFLGVSGSATVGAVNVTAAAICSWTAVSNTPAVVTITEGSSGTGNGTVRFAISANPSANPRVGTVTIAGLLLTINQAGSLPDAASDLDGDRAADLILWRPSDGTWYSLTSTSAFNYSVARAQQWGNAALGDVPLLGDMDGDRLTDLVIWRASTGTWYWLQSSTGYQALFAGSAQWGNASAGDVPMLADMDGDKKMDLVIWRASTGTWYWLTSSTGYSYATAGSKQWGSQALADVPKLADMDGDGLADLVIWRGSLGTWYWLTSSSGYSYAAAGSKQWGTPALGDIPMIGDIDGDRKADIIVWRASTGTWFWLTSSTGFEYANAGIRQWGNQALGDRPTMADFDGDGKADLGIWRASTGTWYSLLSSSGYSYIGALAKQWGSQALGDIPMSK